MAEVELEGQDEVLETPEPRGIRRPAKREIDKKAEQLMDKSILPKIPPRMNGNQWQEYARLFTPEMWGRLALYLYRSFPVIIRQLSDPRNDNNIGILTEVVDIESYVKEMCGGGKYRIDVTDSGKKISEIRINLPIHEAEPKLDYRELDLFAKDNQPYVQSLKFRGILGEDGKPKPGGGNVQGSGNQQSSIGGQDLLNMFDKMMSRMDKMSEDQKADLRARIAAQGTEAGGLGGAIGTLLLERMKQDNPNQVLQSIAAFKDMFKPTGDATTSMMPIFLQFVTMMQEQSKQALEQARAHSEQMVTLLKDVKAGNNRPDNMMQSVEAAIGIAERLKDLGGSGGKSSTAEVILEYVKELGLPMLQYGTRIFEIAKMGKAVTQPTQPGKPTATGARQLTSSDVAMQQARDAARAATTGKENGKVEPPAEIINPTEIAPLSEEDTFLTQIMTSAGRYFVKYLNEDKTGAELALDLINLEGKAAYSRFAAYGEDKLVATAKSIPELWDALTPFGEQAIKQFAEEFCNYEDYIEQEEPEPKPEKRERKGRVKE